MPIDPNLRRTKIVATMGPASNSSEVLRKLILAGMDVARLNFSHGTHDDHAASIARLRGISAELDRPVTILQDLQGPKVRVARLPGNQIILTPGEVVEIVPEADFHGQSATIPIDYPDAAEEAKAGMTILLADGLFELQIVDVAGRALRCRVIEGGVLESRKGVNFPNLNLRLPSLTEKDQRDVEFGISQGVDWFSLSFVRTADDVRVLKAFIAGHNASTPVMAKIEKPQALEHLPAILDEVQGIMVARGDLGVEMSPEKVPMAQKRIIELCNRKGLPVITATQMLESMVHEPRPTRAEASDVANAIIDGTDAVMLSAESAIGQFPVRAVEMMGRIAREVESKITFKSYPPEDAGAVRALSEAANLVSTVLEPRCIVVLTTSGYTARFVAAERPKALVIAVTTDARVYHELNLFWGIRPLLINEKPATFEALVAVAETAVLQRKFAAAGETILVIGGIPAGLPCGSNFLKVHSVTG
jgi:pyruvate kinase